MQCMSALDQRSHPFGTADLVGRQRQQVDAFEIVAGHLADGQLRAVAQQQERLRVVARHEIEVAGDVDDGIARQQRELQ